MNKLINIPWGALRDSLIPITVALLGGFLLSRLLI